MWRREDRGAVERPLTPGVRGGLAFALAAAVLWVLSPALGGDFVYDDLTLVQRNPWITSLGQAVAAWDQPLWGFESERYADQVGFWRPLTVVALAAGRALDGGAPLGHHLVSAAALLLACLASWRLVARLTGSAWTGWAAALLLACHPMTTQAGAWIAAVNDPLAAALVLAALDARRRWQQTEGAPRRARDGRPLVPPGAANQGAGTRPAPGGTAPRSLPPGRGTSAATCAAGSPSSRRSHCGGACGGGCSEARPVAWEARWSISDSRRREPGSCGWRHSSHGSPAR